MATELQKHFKQEDEDFMKNLKGKSREHYFDSQKIMKEECLSRKRFLEYIPLTEMDYSIEQVRETTKLIKKVDAKTQSYLQYLRNAFSLSVDYVNAFFSVENSLYWLTGHLTCKDSTLQLEAALCLTNMSAYTHKKMHAVTKTCGVYFTTYLQSGSQLLAEQSAQVVGNLAVDSKQCRELLIKQGAVQSLVHLIEKSTAETALQSSFFALCNICKSYRSVLPSLRVSSLPNILLKHLRYRGTDVNVIGELAWLLFHLTLTEEDLDAFFDEDVVNDIFFWLCQPGQDLYVVTPLLRCIGNISAARNILLLNTRQQIFCTFLSSKTPHLIKETLWVLSNIIASNTLLNVSPIILASILRHLRSLEKIRREAVICVYNLALRNFNSLPTKDVLASLNELLMTTAHPYILHVALDTLEIIFRDASTKIAFRQLGGLQTLIDLKFRSEASKLCQHISNILLILS